MSKDGLSERMASRSAVLMVCLGLIAPAALPLNAHACSGFCLDSADRHVCGRNLDWSFDECLVMVNKRSVAKTAFTYYGDTQSAMRSWTSKYGSVTFNQYGREVAFSGMNERGFVVDGMLLSESIYPPSDGRAVVTMDQWVQYLLDNCATTPEAIAAMVAELVHEYIVG
jgi:choloylglycine hydrolase